MSIDRPSEELIERCLAGESEAWTRLAARARPVIAGAVEHLLRRWGQPVDPARIDDHVQDVFVALMRDESAALRRFRWTCSLNHYLASLAVHHVIDGLRRERRILSLDAETAAGTLMKDLVSGDAPADPAAAMDSSEQRERLADAMEKLPEEERLALHLFYWRSLPAGSVGRMLGMRPDAARMFLMRARKRLEGLLRGLALLAF